jgi:hypothetical protein
MISSSRPYDFEIATSPAYSPFEKSIIIVERTMKYIVRIEPKNVLMMIIFQSVEGKKEM